MHQPVADLLARAVAALPPTLRFEGAELAVHQDGGAVDGGRVQTFGVDRSATATAHAELSRGDYSQSLWPAAEACSLDDASVSLDRELGADRQLIEQGARGLLAVPLVAGPRPLGLFVLWRRDPGAFVALDRATLDPVIALLSIALERERLFSLEAARQGRRDRLEALLPAIAEALDVRQVFLGMSAVIRDVVPHDVLAFALLTPDRGGVRVQAATDAGMHEMPEYRFTNEQEALDANWRYLLAYDIALAEEGVLRCRISPRSVDPPVEVMVKPGLAWTRFVHAAGIRSTLRVPIRSKDRPIGGVVFLSHRPDAYDEEHGALALRMADHLALALAHRELAMEERRIAQAEERAAVLEARVDSLSRELDRYGAHRPFGNTAKWKKVLADAAQVAATETTVLVTGESGTGKEVIARFLHRGSPRARGPFVAINCAALPEQLLESELFGHERGAFTGALAARPGKIEQAAGGVLFLDEVGEMSPSVQAKLLRVLQEREFQRVGGTRTLKADVRVVAATNRDPRRAIESGQLREDLYYRLGVFEMKLPPLRERPEDILVLAQVFLEEFSESVGRPPAGFGDDARELLLAHPWPGNVRELRNAIERAVILCRGGVVAREHLPLTIAGAPDAARDPAPSAPPAAEELPAAGLRLDDVERDLLQKALAKAGDNKSKTARLLGVTRGQLYSLLRKHGLTDARR